MNCVFIVGMNGSGTTMLLDCLDSHPELYGFPRETKILPYYIRGLSKYGNLDKDKNFLRLYNDLRKEFVFWIVNKGETPPLPANWRDLPRDFGSVIDSILMYFTVQAGKKRWCEKTPMHILHMLALSKLFPNAKFIHVIRDGRACAASFHRRWHYKPQLTIYRWKKVVREGRNQGVSIGERYYEVFYEELTADPEHWMKKICAFLGLPYDDRVLKVSRKRVMTGSSARGIVCDQKIWPSYFNKRDIESLELIAGSELMKFGYRTRYPDSDADPSRLVLLYWTYCGHSRAKINELFRRVIKKRQEGQWRYYINWIKDAIRSRTTTKY
jgi:hypothetical protein